MKNLILFIFLFSLVFTNGYGQDSTSKRLAFGFYGGIQLPEEDKLDAGPWFGVFVSLPTGLGWSLQLEYNFWKAIDDSRVPDEDVFVSEFPLLVAYKWEISNIYLKALAGPGIASSGSTLFGGDRDFLLSFETALNVGLSITKDANGFIQVRKQWAGSLSAGGGPSYSPYLFCLGFEYRIN
ncbi:MAG: hypothetical protein HXY48_02925 [Ignavibacteriaceae bacterium]|nr:hypothetical protein [Ignavibacteriaceae bacterium]